MSSHIRTVSFKSPAMQGGVSPTTMKGTTSWFQGFCVMFGHFWKFHSRLMLDDMKDLINRQLQGGEDWGSAFTLIGEVFPFGVRERCPVARFHELSVWRLSRASCGVATLKHILFSLKCRSVEAVGCGSTSGVYPPESPGCPARWLAVAFLGEFLYAWVADGWPTLPPLSRVLRCRDGWWRVLTHDRPWLSVH